MTLKGMMRMPVCKLLKILKAKLIQPGCKLNIRKIWNQMMSGRSKTVF